MELDLFIKPPPDPVRRVGAAREARDAAIDEVEAGADREWKRAALAAVRRLAGRGLPFSTDSVWEEMGEAAPVREPRAMGAVIRRAFTTGIIQPRLCDRCGQQETVDGPERNHGRPMALWEARRS